MFPNLLKAKVHRGRLTFLPSICLNPIQDQGVPAGPLLSGRSPACLDRHSVTTTEVFSPFMVNTHVQIDNCLSLVPMLLLCSVRIWRVFSTVVSQVHSAGLCVEGPALFSKLLPSKAIRARASISACWLDRPTVTRLIKSSCCSRVPVRGRDRVRGIWGKRKYSHEDAEQFRIFSTHFELYRRLETCRRHRPTGACHHRLALSRHAISAYSRSFLSVDRVTFSHSTMHPAFRGDDRTH